MQHKYSGKGVVYWEAVDGESLLSDVYERTAQLARITPKVESGAGAGATSVIGGMVSDLHYRLTRFCLMLGAEDSLKAASRTAERGDELSYTPKAVALACITYLGYTGAERQRQAGRWRRNLLALIPGMPVVVDSPNYPNELPMGGVVTEEPSLRIVKCPRGVQAGTLRQPNLYQPRVDIAGELMLRSGNDDLDLRFNAADLGYMHVGSQAINLFLRECADTRSIKAASDIQTLRFNYVPRFKDDALQGEIDFSAIRQY